MKPVRVAIVGNGDRANCYCQYALTNPEDLQVTAIVDPNERKLQEGKEKYGVAQEYLFKSVEDFLEYERVHGRSVDGVIVATMDELHYETAMPFLKKG